MLVSDTNFQESLLYLWDKNVIAIDVETSGLNTYKGDRIIGIAMASNGNSFYFPTSHLEGKNISEENIGALKSLASLPNKTWVFWNGKFDMGFFRNEGWIFTGTILDPMLGLHLLDENMRNYKLKDTGVLYQEHISIGSEYAANAEQDKLKELMLSRGLTMGQMEQLLPEEVSDYAEMDVILTEALLDFFIPYLKEADLYDIWLEVCEFSEVIGHIEKRGMLIDLQEVDIQLTTCIKQMEKAKKRLADIVGYEVNPNSPKQVQSALHIKGSTRLEVLEALDTPESQLVVSYRQWSKMLSSYYKPYKENVDSHSILHPQLWLIGTETSRLSCRNPNLQAIPRKEEYRDGEEHPKAKVKTVFIARDGYVLVQADYKQAEIYLGTHYAGATRMKDMLESGVDIHTETANMVGIPRYAAKRMNFAIQYGIGPKALSEDIKCSYNEARSYINAYNEVHPEFRNMFLEYEQIAEKNKEIRLFTGRRKRYDHPKAECYKASSNLIQGGVAEIVRLVMTRMHNELYHLGIHQLLQVHDSIIFEIPEDKLWLIESIRYIMEDLEYFYRFWVKFKVDIQYGKSWYTMQEYTHPTH